jgi:hypothetical protein
VALGITRFDHTQPYGSSQIYEKQMPTRQFTWIPKRIFFLHLPKRGSGLALFKEVLHNKKHTLKGIGGKMMI